MAQQTQLHVNALPGKVQSFSAKTEAPEEAEPEREDYHLLPKRFPEWGLGDMTILRSFPKRSDHGYG